MTIENHKIIPSLTIEKLALHGYGIGFHEGKAVLVPYTLPGDVVTVTLRHEKKDICFGTVTAYIRRSEFYREPGCEVFDPVAECGGCDWLMAEYPQQLSWKRQLLAETFRQLAEDIPIGEAVASPLEKFYRNKVFLPCGKADGGICFGIYQRYSHTVVPHKQCLLQPPVMDEILQEIVSFAKQVKMEAYDEANHSGVLRHVGIRVNAAGDEVLVIPVTRTAKFPFSLQFVRTLTARFPQITGIVQNINRQAGNVILGGEDKLLYGNPWLKETLDGITYSIHYRSFWQVNTGVTQLLCAWLKDRLEAEETVLDAYSGIGSIGLYVAGKVKSVIGIEEVPEAVRDAEFNRKQNGMDNAVFHLGKVEDLLPALMQESAFTTAILDPPRKGVEASVLLALAEQEIRQILYISCNPMTLVRDLKLLCGKGYKVAEVTPFDMFPQTWHIETAVRLIR